MSKKKKFDPLEVIKELELQVEGQARPIQELTMGFHRNMLISLDKERYRRVKPKGILLLGDTGVGKTYLMRSFAKILGLRFTEVNAKSLTASGYEGASFSEMIAKNREGLPEEAISIIYIDEMDKMLMSRPEMRYNVNYAATEELLSYLEGTPATLRGESIPTNRILFTGSGRGSKELYETRSTVGDGLTEQLLHREQMMAVIGAGDELAGRFQLILMNQLSNKTKSKILASRLTDLQRDMTELGLPLEFTDDAIELMEEAVFSSRYGARSIEAPLDHIYQTFGSVADKFSEHYMPLVIDAECLEDPKNVLPKNIREHNVRGFGNGDFLK